MEPWKRTSVFRCLFSPVSALPIGDERFIAATAGVFEAQLEDMTPLSAALNALLRSFGSDGHLCNAVRNVLDFVQYLQICPSAPSYEQQLRIINRMRSWSTRMPSAVVGIATRDVRHLLAIAYYHTAVIAAEPYIPAAIAAMFPLQRTEIIGRIYHEIEQQALSRSWEQQAQIREYHRMLTVPLLYAARYRSRHCVIS